MSDSGWLRPLPRGLPITPRAVSRGAARSAYNHSMLPCSPFNSASACWPSTAAWERKQRRREWNWPPRKHARLTWCSPPWHYGDWTIVDRNPISCATGIHNVPLVRVLVVRDGSTEESTMTYTELAAKKLASEEVRWLASQGR